MPSLSQGARVGPYEVIAPLGAGGMGEVFRARDLTLNRNVALKILPPGLVDDPERRRRFAREAQLLASLNHPHIAQVFGIEESAAGPAIAMELVEGRSLREVLFAGPLPPGSALSLARAVATALDAAHEKGIVHRDLKPGNVVVTPDGTAKVLDFGLAKAGTDETEPDETAITQTGGTMPGSVLGTPAYMSPEQARGQVVDRRTDIWAFGCLLFEMLSGRQAFEAPTVSDTVSAVLGRYPDWQLLPAETPAGVRQLIQRCLQKDRRARLRDIGDALYALSDSEGGADSARSPTSAGPTATPRSHRVVMLALAASTLALAASTAWLLTQRTSSSTGAVPIRLALPPPSGAQFGSRLPRLEANTLAMAPDGRSLAFIATKDGEAEVWIRDLGDEEARPIAGTAGAVSAFWSPDSRALGFFAAGQLKRVDVGGGAPVKVCDVPVGIGMAGTWSATGTILFASVTGDAIFEVPAAGGSPVARVTRSEEADRRVLWPSYLPDGRSYLYTSLQNEVRGRIILTRGDGSSTTLVEADSLAQWVTPDWLLYVREGTLVAQRVDLEAGRIADDPVALVGLVGHSIVTGWSAFSASLDGTLVVQSHLDQSGIVRVDRAGRDLGDIAGPGGYLSLRLSPDGGTLASSRMRAELGTYDLWTTDLARGTETRVTLETGMEVGETWVPPDGRTLVFASGQGAAPNLELIDLTTGDARRLQTTPRFQLPNDVSPDGAWIGYQERTERGDWDLLVAPLAAPESPTPLFTTPASEMQLQFSPDGRAIAYTSTASSRPQVYLSRFPADGSRPVPVSSAGGQAPRWSRNGRELFFLSANQQLMVTPIDAAGRPGDPRPLFDVTRWLSYDVTPDGQFVAIVLQVNERDQPLTVIVGWPGLVGR